jgi:uncharacterized protein (TIGR03083 family)
MLRMEISAARVAADRHVIGVAGEALGRRADTSWDLAVPACPGWDVGTVLAHVGGVHRWATANLTTGRARRRDLPPPPTERPALLAWYREGLTALVETAGRVDPTAEVWTFGASGERRGAWWVRRMAQETAMHHRDAEVAAGADVGPLDADQAVAGIDEYLADFLPRLPPEAAAGLTGTLHLHVTDGDGEWLVDLADLGAPVRHEHAKADTAVRGPASDLLLWLWNRQAPRALTVFGDSAIVERWTDIRM